MSEKSIKKNALLNTFKTFLALCFPLITFPYSSRILGPENLGKVNFAQSIVSYFAILASLGITTYATREAAKVRDNKQKLNQLCKEIFSINMIATVISYGLLAISLFAIKKFMYYRELIIICSSLILFTTIGMGWLYQALEDYLYITIRSIFFQIISVIMLFTLVKSKDDYLWYAAINIISNVGAKVFNFIHSRKFISFKGTEKCKFKKHLTPIFVLFASAIAGTVFASIDTTMIGFITTDEEVGFYNAGIKIIHMIKNIFPAIAIVIFPRISYYIAKNDQTSIIDLSSKSINFLICTALPVTAGIFLLVEPLVILFCGPTYQAAVPVSQIMSPFIIITAVSGFIGSNLIIAFGKEKLSLIVTLSACVVDIILNAILIPPYKAYGAATATLITEFIILAFYIVYLKNFLKELKLILPVFQYIIATFIMSLLVFFIRNHISNILLKLLVSFICGVIIYFLTLFLIKNKFVNVYGKEILSKMFNKIINKKGN